MSKKIALSIRPLDKAPRFGTGGPNVSIWDADRKSTAAKLPEEAAEAFHEWQDFERRAHYLRVYRDFVANEDCGTVHDMQEELRRQRDRLGDELADMIVAAVDLAMVCGVDLQAALDRNDARQT